MGPAQGWLSFIVAVVASMCLVGGPKRTCAQAQGPTATDIATLLPSLTQRLQQANSTGSVVDWQLPAGQISVSAAVVIDVSRFGRPVSVRIASNGSTTLDCNGRNQAFIIRGAQDVSLVGLTIQNCAVPGTGQDAGGGAVYLQVSGTATIQSCSFIGNRALNASAATGVGGALYLDTPAPEPAVPPHVTVQDCTFQGGYATWGAGIGISGANVELQVVNSVFVRNKVELYGSGIHVDRTRANIAISGSNFFENTAVLGAGGVHVVSSDGRVDITNTTFSSNAGYQSGALRVKDVSGPVTLSQLRVTRNKADGFGGGLVAWNCADLTVKDSSFQFNTAQSGGGGAIAVQTTTRRFQIINTDFTSNTGQDGGAIWALMTGVSTIVTDSLFVNNSAASFGGALYLRDTTGNASITRCMMINNAASKVGGGLYAENTTTAFTIQDSMFQNNAARETCPAARSSTSVSVANTTFSSNTGQVATNPIDCLVVAPASSTPPQPPNTVTSPSSSSGPSSKNMGIIIGSVLGGVALIALIAVALITLLARRKQQADLEPKAVLPQTADPKTAPSPVQSSPISMPMSSLEEDHSGGRSDDHSANGLVGLSGRLETSGGDDIDDIYSFMPPTIIAQEDPSALTGMPVGEITFASNVYQVTPTSPSTPPVTARAPAPPLASPPSRTSPFAVVRRDARSARDAEVASPLRGGRVAGGRGGAATQATAPAVSSSRKRSSAERPRETAVTILHDNPLSPSQGDDMPRQHATSVSRDSVTMHMNPLTPLRESETGEGEDDTVDMHTNTPHPHAPQAQDREREEADQGQEGRSFVHSNPLGPMSSQPSRIPRPPSSRRNA